jgi:hypothetical protein
MEPFRADSSDSQVWFQRKKWQKKKKNAELNRKMRKKGSQNCAHMTQQNGRSRTMKKETQHEGPEKA